MSAKRGTRVALGVLGLAALALAANLGLVVARKGDRRVRPLEEIAAVDKPDATVGEQSAAVERALALEPGLEEAHGFRAFVLARQGDLEAAKAALARAGASVQGRRADAWIRFRRGEVDEALGLLDPTAPFAARDRAELLCAAGRPTQDAEPVPRTALWWERVLSQKIDATRAQLDAIVTSSPRSIEALTALRARARMEVLAFDDAAAVRDAEQATLGPPREKTLGEPELAAIRKAVSGVRALDPLPPLVGAGDPSRQDVWRALSADTIDQALVELERDRLIDSNDDLDRAERRLTRLRAVLPGDRRAPAFLARALERRPARNERELATVTEALEKSLGDDPSLDATRKLELARLALIRGDLDAARGWLSRLSAHEQEDALVRRLRAVVEKDGKLAATTFGIDDATDATELMAWLKCALAFVLERPWDARVELDSLSIAHPKTSSLAVAEARVREDPCGTLLALVRSKEPLTLAHKNVGRAAGAVVLIAKDTLNERLQERGLETPEDINKALDIAYGTER